MSFLKFFERVRGPVEPDAREARLAQVDPRLTPTVIGECVMCSALRHGEGRVPATIF